MHCVAHRIVDAADVVRDFVVEMPHVRSGHGDVFRKTPVAINADDTRVRADMSVAGSTQQTASIYDVTFRGHAISLAHVRDKITDAYYISGEFVADYERRLATRTGPTVPLVDVDVRAAYARSAHADEDFIVTDHGFRDVAQHETGAGSLLEQRFQVRCGREGKAR